jgi:hypothetical protein
MKIDNYQYTNSSNWNKKFDTDFDSKNTLIIIFSSLEIVELKQPLQEIREKFPQSIIIGASTAGEIFDDEIYDDSIIVTIIQFENTRIASVSKPIESKNSFSCGIKATLQLIDDDLKSIIVLSDGLLVNGSKLTKGISSVLPKSVTVTGGLAADKDRFNETWVLVDGKPEKGFVTMVGFYGENINVSHGSKGGWDKLGLERVVTRSEYNVLYELDGQPALTLYKEYLGALADDLPSSGLLFPLEIKDSKNSTETQVRTILGIDEKENSITFAGDIPVGSYATLMKANMDRLIDGSAEAAKMLDFNKNKGESILTVAISCVGRRLVLKQRTEEELESNLDIFPANTQQIGFYSYGEITTNNNPRNGRCELQNQTMTLTSFWESNSA